jgi:hypothetical protein
MACAALDQMRMKHVTKNTGLISKRPVESVALVSRRQIGGMAMTSVRVLEKHGGKTGDWTAEV